MSFWNSATLIFLFSAILFICICFRSNVLREIASLKDRTGTVGFTLANQIAAMTATVLAYWAVQLSPVALASTIFNSKPLFIFAFSGLAARIAPGFLIHEKSSRKLLLVRAGATLLVVGGLVLMLV
jgi:drug/metabolite transporter (DMT)-like permease